MELLLDILIAVVFGLLTIMSLARVNTPAGREPARWIAAAMTSIGSITVLGLVIPENSTADWMIWVSKTLIIVLALFPFFLYRFARSITDFSLPMRTIINTLTFIVCTWTLLLPEIPAEGEPQSAMFKAYSYVFIAHFVIVSLGVAVMLWRFGRDKSSVVRSRMRTMAAGAAFLAVALLMTTVGGNAVVDTTISLLAMASGITFYAGYLAPGWLRTAWRLKDYELFQTAATGLLQSDDSAEITGALLPQAAALLGANGAAFVRQDGSPIAAWNIDRYVIDSGANALPDHAALSAGKHHDALGGTPLMMYHWHEDGWLLVTVDPCTPFFGHEEIALISAILNMYNLAITKVNAAEHERALVQRLQELDSLKNEFVAMVAHDLRSPMTVISGFADTLRQHGETLSKEQQDQFLGMISDTVHSISNLVEDVLHVARIESGQYTYDLTNFDLAALADRIVTEYKILHPDREISVETLETNVIARGDAERVVQVLSNLVSNAVKYSPEDAPIELFVNRNGTRCSVAVRDHGMGIKEEDMPLLFAKFSRILPAAGEPRIKGTGLGLYICKSIINALDGEIQAESTVGEGSTFSFSLPLGTQKEVHR